MGIQKHQIECTLQWNILDIMVSSSHDKKNEHWEGFLREPLIAADEQSAQTFAGKRVLVTGAGGYIGSALALSLAGLPIERLVLLDNSEHGLYLLDNKFAEKTASFDYTMIVGSICDRALVQEIFARHQPHIVFHAAALKHVQLMESSPFAAIETNALGTKRIAQAAAGLHAEQLILVSTDKAVDPISIMGASKRLAELVILSNQSSTKMKALRLCNVLGSTGSVAPLFEAQIRNARPVTVTHKETTRFFLSIERTVECLLRVASDSSAGLFIPQTGDAYRIEDLARFVAGRSSADEWPIVYTGLRVGDKLHEQMISRREQYSTENLDQPFNACRREVVQEQHLAEEFEQISHAVSTRDFARLMRTVKRLVPEYSASRVLNNFSNDPVSETL